MALLYKSGIIEKASGLLRDLKIKGQSIFRHSQIF